MLRSINTRSRHRTSHHNIGCRLHRQIRRRWCRSVHTEAGRHGSTACPRSRCRHSTARCCFRRSVRCSRRSSGSSPHRTPSRYTPLPHRGSRPRPGRRTVLARFEAHTGCPRSTPGSCPDHKCTRRPRIFVRDRTGCRTLGAGQRSPHHEQRPRTHHGENPGRGGDLAEHRPGRSPLSSGRPWPALRRCPVVAPDQKSTLPRPGS